MLTLFWLCMTPAPAPPPNVPPATAAMNNPENSSTVFRWNTIPLAMTFATPTSPMLNPVTVNGYFSPRYSRTPSPQPTPRPAATDMVSMVTFPVVSSFAHAGAAASSRTATAISTCTNGLCLSIVRSPLSPALRVRRWRVPCRQRHEGTIGLSSRALGLSPYVDLAADAIGLGGIEPACPGQRPQHAPGAARGEQPVRLAAEGAHELLPPRRTPHVDRMLEVAGHLLDAVLRDDAADPDRQPERDRRERNAQREERRVVAEPVREVPGQEAESGIDDGGDRPLDDLVADVAAELGGIERGRRRAPGAPEERDVVEHAFVPARVLPDHLLSRLRQVDQLEQRQRRHEQAARAQRV